MIKGIIAAVAALASAGVSAADCPTFRPGQPYPWQASEELMPGDQWAWLFIDLDAKGKPKGCKVGEHKYQPETGFWMCRAMMASGDFEPVMKDGVAVEGTVKRFMTVPGRQRQRAEQVARKQWFKDNPHERPSCYPR